MVVPSKVVDWFASSANAGDAQDQTGTEPEFWTSESDSDVGNATLKRVLYNILQVAVSAHLHAWGADLPDRCRLRASHGCPPRHA